MSDWRETLARGEVLCRVLHDDKVLKTSIPTHEDELWLPIRIRELGETAQGEYLTAYAKFVASGDDTNRYQCSACSTIVKFSNVLQFKEMFVVEFTRQTPAESRPIE
jgi:hypothetical protein